MRRVLVIGSGGAGKSTLARRIAERTGLPLIHLDALYWKPGWVETPKAEWDRVVDQLIARDTWVMDGNYGGTLPQRLAACDTVVFLDIPRLRCLGRVLLRGMRHFGRTRPDMAPGCPEQLPSLEFLQWIWTYPARRRPVILGQLEATAAHARVIVLRDDAAASKFLESLRPGEAP
jgi:adenylate kinase family enzyme